MEVEEKMVMVMKMTRVVVMMTKNLELLLEKDPNDFRLDCVIDSFIMVD